MNNQIQLKSIISQVITALLPVAVLKHSFFINDVSPHLQLTRNEKEVAATIRKLLLEEVFLTNDACIRISASEENEQLCLTVHKKGPFALPLI